MDIKLVKIADLKHWDKNPRRITEDGIQRLKTQITELEQYKPLIVANDNIVIGGNMRLMAMRDLGFEEVWVSDIGQATEEKMIKVALSDNDRAGMTDEDKLMIIVKDFPQIEWKNFSVDMGEPVNISDLINDEKDKEGEGDKKKLTDKFLIPPFSVFDTRQGYWQDRKRMWLGMGIESEVGRDGSLLGLDKLKNLDYFSSSQENIGTSVFDPVVCELGYRWFNIEGGSILDPFAGGSVRGIVAEKLGYKYTGIDLSEKQILANRENAKKLQVEPNWIIGDSDEQLDKLHEKYDMIFSCPPYMDLEVYSKDEKDISAMNNQDFERLYKSIIKKSVDKLNDNRFAMFTVSEVRGKDGNFKGFVPMTIEAFEEAGMKFYNEVILVNVAGTLPFRVGKQFNSGRKVGRMHQNILIFYKGTTKEIKNTFKELDFTELSSEGGENNV